MRQKQEEKMTQVASFNRIYKKVSVDGMSEGTVKELRNDIDFIAGLYSIDETSVVLLSAILEKSSSNNLMDDEDLARFIGCTNIEFIQYNEKLREMDKAGIIGMGSGRRDSRCYRVTQELLKAVENNCEFKPVKMFELTHEELFSRFRKFFEYYKKDAIDPDRLLLELDTLVNNNNHLTFCKKALDSAIYNDCSDTERRMFFYLCQRLVSNGEKSVDVDILTNFCDCFIEDDYYKRRISHEYLPMQQKGLVCFAMEDGYVDMSALSLSDIVKEDFLCEIELPSAEPIRFRDLVSVDSIQEKELFYNESEGSQVARLEGLLDLENFKKVQSRLLSTGMRKGFNALFYGSPGTGKTASVYELARRSGRDIFRVDMAKLKSKWVGESEKSVRSVFRMYRNICKSNEKAPILLFNEADAIFSKRLENVERSVDQMNNSIQNIILEEMENIDGILIATTNLLANLDPAFERRFIFKVEFKLPEKDSRAKIWKSMVPSLSEEEATLLADRYVFSGGNIENIARKSAVEYVLSGNEPTLSSLEGYCQEEILNRRNTRNKIGF